MGSNDWAYVSTATKAQLCCIFFNDFGHFMMFREMAVDWLEVCISPISIFTIFESGAKLLNQIILNCLFLVFYFDLFPLSLTFNWSNIKNTNYYICKLSRYNLLMVSSKPICFQFCFPNFQITERLFHPRVLLKLNLENPTIQE